MLSSFKLGYATAVFANDLSVVMTTQTLIFLKQSYSIISSVLVQLGLILSSISLSSVKLSPTLGDLVIESSCLLHMPGP